uniref:Major facilitator superfamily (MFS) profile domain-containing protein n=1 Tax=Acrobeloides nanus TaxID=290746 RepID=A0A914CI02_9BILA
MVSSFLKYPVFQTLLYEKSCIYRYHDDINCHNISHIYSDKLLQHDANHLYLLSSLTLIIPSLFSTLILGSLSDSWNVKVPMLVPFVALILADFSYILQCTFMNWNPYYLLISDFIFGLFGGFTAIIGTMSSYAIKTTSSNFRSERMAAFEGSIGLGTTFGYAVSGLLREAVGYAYVFLILMVLHISAFVYILFFTKEIIQNDPSANEI